MAQQALRIRVKGKVQGVFFRASTKEKADELDIKGWVRNEPDGSVLIEAEGGEGKLKEFLDWCWEGPSAARVEEVQEEVLDPKDLDSFAIVG